jgi:hypothetical protein
MNLVSKGLVKLATSFVENNDFRNDLLLSFLSKEQVQEHEEVFDSLYTDSLEEYVFGLTGKKDVNVESLKQGRSILSYKNSIQKVESSVKM